MPSWKELISKFESFPDDSSKNQWIRDLINEYFSKISELRNNNNVIFYSSAYMQKPGVNPYLVQITPEDLNGFMTAIHGMNRTKSLSLILHTPGGITNAAETIIDYINREFEYIEVIVPTYAMSAGTMISLCFHKVIMGKQSQLGPIDPQLQVGNNRYASALSIRDQFLRARSEIIENKDNAHVWAPILSSLGPALLQEAENAITYGEDVVKAWLMRNMFRDNPDKEILASQAAKYFSQCEKNTSHGRRINRDEVESQNIIIEKLESNRDFQDAIMTLYHLFTILFEKGPAAKIIISSTKANWIKNVSGPTIIQPKRIQQKTAQFHRP